MYLSIITSVAAMNNHNIWTFLITQLGWLVLYTPISFHLQEVCTYSAANEVDAATTHCDGLEMVAILGYFYLGKWCMSVPCQSQWGLWLL